MKPQHQNVAACRRCGSLRIEVEAWHDLNRGTLIAWQEQGDVWCPRCEQHDKYTLVLYRDSDGTWHEPCQLRGAPSLKAALRRGRELLNRRKPKDGAR